MQITKLYGLFLILMITINSFSSTQENNNEEKIAQLAKVQFEKAEIFMTNRVFDSAYIYYMDAWQYFSNSDNWEKKVKIMSQVCAINYKTGQLEEAKIHADTALNILMDANADTLHHLYGSVYHQYGTVEHIMGNFAKARDFYKKAIVIREKGNPLSSNIERTYNNLGLALTSLSDCEEAIVYLQKNVSFCLKYHPDDDYNIGRSYCNLGVAYSEKMDLDNADKYYRIGLEYYLKVMEEPNDLLGDIYMNLSKIAVNNGDYKKAIQLNKRALENYNNTKTFSRNAPMAYLNLSVAYKMMENYDSAHASIDKAIELKREQFGEKNHDLAHVLQYKGRIYHADGKYDEALKYFQESIIANVLDFNESDLNSNPDLSHVLLPRTLAASFVWKGTAWQSMYYESGNMEYLISGLNAYYAFDELTDKMFFDFANDNSRYQLINDYFTYYYEVMQLVHEMYKASGDQQYIEDAFYFSEKCKSALLTNGISETQARLFANIPEKLLMKEKTFREIRSSLENQYNEALLYTPEDSVLMLSLSDSLFNVINEHKRLISEFEEEYPSYYELKYNRKPAGIQDIRSGLLDENGVLVEYFYGDSTIYVIGITHNDLEMEKFKIDDSFKEYYDQFIRCSSDFEYINSNIEKSSTKYIESASALYSILFPNEIKKLLLDKSQLCIISGHKLAYLPFDALLTEKVNEGNSNYAKFPYLIKKVNIQHAFSASLLLKEGQKGQASDLYAGFAPDYNTKLLSQAEELKNYSEFRDNIGSLSENKSEIEEVSEILNGTTFIAEQATERNFKENAENYSIIHLAMHAVLDDKNPLSSKLIFSQTNDTIEDNFLNTYEIYNLSLGSDLAILSACNTANGILDKGEGVLSLSRAFKYAGVNSIVSSLWLAHDEVTKNIIMEFFNGVKKKLPLDMALRNSKLNHLKNADPQFAHPYFWANFVLIGDKKPIVQKNKWFKNYVFILSGVSLILLISLLWFTKRKS